MEGGRVSGANGADRHARRGFDVRPGEQHPSGSVERILRRNDQIDQIHGQNGGQHLAETNQARPIDGGLDADIGQVGGGAMFDRVVDRRGQFLPAAAKQQEVDQAVPQRGTAGFDRQGGEDRIYSTDHRRQQTEEHERPRRANKSQPEEPSRPCRQAADEQPMVGQRDDEQIAERADGQRGHSAGNVHDFYLPARLAEPLVNKILVLGRLRDEWRRRRQWWQRCTRHGGYPALNHFFSKL